MDTDRICLWVANLMLAWIRADIRLELGDEVAIEVARRRPWPPALEGTEANDD